MLAGVSLPHEGYCETVQILNLQIMEFLMGISEQLTALRSP